MGIVCCAAEPSLQNTVPSAWTCGFALRFWISLKSKITNPLLAAGRSLIAPIGNGPRLRGIGGVDGEIAAASRTVIGESVGSPASFMTDETGEFPRRGQRGR